MHDDDCKYIASKVKLQYNRVLNYINSITFRYHRKTGITFASLYPGCIAESPLFREKVSSDCNLLFDIITNSFEYSDRGFVSIFLCL